MCSSFRQTGRVTRSRRWPRIIHLQSWPTSKFSYASIVIHFSSFPLICLPQSRLKWSSRPPIRPTAFHRWQPFVKPNLSRRLSRRLTLNACWTLSLLEGGYTRASSYPDHHDHFNCAHRLISFTGKEGTPSLLAPLWSFKRTSPTRFRTIPSIAPYATRWSSAA
jgi:hypothetical protein